MEKVPYLGKNLVRWQVGTSTFLAMPEKGARLMHWHVTLGDGTVRDVIHWPDLETLEDFHKVRGGNPVLFPFSGRCFDENELYYWRTPDGTRRPMPMHGIARQGEFKVTRLDARGFAAQLIPSEEARIAYPFDYEFSVTYLFEPLGLKCEFTLRNLGKQPIPWSAGHHFYFSVPWQEGAKRSDYAIRIPATQTKKQDQTTGALVAGPSVRPQEVLSNPDLLDTIHLGLKSSTVVFGPPNAPGEVAVRLGAEKLPPPEAAFVTWTSGDDAPYFCVEPWMGPPNAPGNQVGLSWVPPGQTQSFIVSVQAK